MKNNWKFTKTEIKEFKKSSDIFDNLSKPLNKASGGRFLLTFILGKKSTGKTFNVVKEALSSWIINGQPSAYVRVSKEAVESYSSNFGDFLKIINWPARKNILISGKGFFRLKNKTKRKNEKTRKIEPILFFLSINNIKNIQSTTFPKINFLIIDELLDHFGTSKTERKTLDKIASLISTVCRINPNVKIIFLGNLINQNNLILNKFKIEEIVSKMKPGEWRWTLRSGENVQIYIPRENEKFKKAISSSPAFKFAKLINSDYSNIITSHSYGSWKISFLKIVKLGSFIQVIELGGFKFGFFKNHENYQISERYNKNGKIAVLDPLDLSVSNYLASNSFSAFIAKLIFEDKIEFDNPNTFLLFKQELIKKAL